MSIEILKGRDDGLEEIVSLLREYELTETDKNKFIKKCQIYIIQRYSLKRIENEKTGSFTL